MTGQPVHSYRSADKNSTYMLILTLEEAQTITPIKPWPMWKSREARCAGRRASHAWSTAHLERALKSRRGRFDPFQNVLSSRCAAVGWGAIIGRPCRSRFGRKTCNLSLKKSYLGHRDFWISAKQAGSSMIMIWCPAQSGVGLCI